MQQTKNRNFKQMGVLALLGFLASAGISLAKSTPTYAIDCANGSISCVAVQFGQPVGDRTLNPSSNVYSATQFYLPVAININHATGYAVDYSVKVYGSGSNLSDVNNSNNTIPSILQNTSYNDLGKNGSEWGIRWNLGDQIADAHSDYRSVPTSIDDPSAIVIADGKMDKNTNSLTKQLTIGFAVAVNGNQASGSYSNTITVAVVASPKDARTLFDISTMQEMDSEICERTTTPATKTISTGADINVTATGASYTTAIDTTGTHQGNGAYVPQRELTDTRDGKKYTVRKLADGNCWMVSNLEFDLVPTSNKNTSAGTTTQSAFSTTGEDKLIGSDLILTNKDTDLNSIREWTPAIAAELYDTAGTVYKTQRNAGQGAGTESEASATTAKKWNKDGSDGLRSFSSAVGYPGALYSTKTAATPIFDVANSGDPWQKFGNLYNWTSATLGSGAKITANNENAEDSICPRGWKLPYNTGNDSFSNLMEAYGLPSVNTEGITDKANQLANFPLNFMRTGYYHYSNGDLRYRLAAGVWWSGSSSSPVDAYDLGTTTANIVPQYTDNRGVGFAIRCVAR